jgi:hypothetical protein
LQAMIDGMGALEDAVLAAAAAAPAVRLLEQLSGDNDCLQHYSNDAYGRNGRWL